MNRNFDVVVIGAGAAGLMCAIEAGKRNKKVLIIEHTSKIGEKIRISGGGRCNFTNLYSSNGNFISKNIHFSKSAFGKYDQNDFINLVNKHSIEFYEKKLGQLFCKKSAKEIIDMLIFECEKQHIKIKMETSIDNISKKKKRENFREFKQETNILNRQRVRETRNKFHTTIKVRAIHNI